MAGQAIWTFLSRPGLAWQPKTQTCRNNLNLIAHPVGYGRRLSAQYNTLQQKYKPLEAGLATKRWTQLDHDLL